MQSRIFSTLCLLFILNLWFPSIVSAQEQRTICENKVCYDENITYQDANGTMATIENFTIPSGNNRLLVITIWQSIDMDVLPTEVTFNDQVLQSKNEFKGSLLFSDEIIEYVLLLGSGNAISGPIKVTFDTDVQFTVSAVSFQNVDQESPFPNQSGGGSGLGFMDFTINTSVTDASDMIIANLIVDASASFTDNEANQQTIMNKVYADADGSLQIIQSYRHGDPTSNDFNYLSTISFYPYRSSFYTINYVPAPPSLCETTDHTVEAGIIPDQTSLHYKTIATSGVVSIPEGHEVTFQASESITLNAGFEAIGPFTASIAPCPTEAAFNETEQPSVIKQQQRQVNNHKEHLQLQVFPNPSNGLINVHIQNPTSTIQAAKLMLVDAFGQVVQDWSNQVAPFSGSYQFVAPIPHQQSGIYFLILENGVERVVKKVIVLE